MSRKLFICLVLTLCSLSVIRSALAADGGCPDPRVPLTFLILPPPMQDSAETEAELKELRQLEAQRTDEQAAEAAADYDRSIRRFLEPIGIRVGSPPESANEFFNCLLTLAKSEVSNAKDMFNRTRPYKLPNNKLHYLKEASDDDRPSYPSGHAAYATLAGIVLAEMLPERRDQILQRARDFGYSRLVAGVHFRSDVYAGAIAGATIAAALFANDDFRRKFEMAKVEVRKALGW